MRRTVTSIQRVKATDLEVKFGMFSGWRKGESLKVLGLPDLSHSRADRLRKLPKKGLRRVGVVINSWWEVLKWTRKK